MTIRLYGLHDQGGEEVLQYGDWIVISELVGNGMGRDYRSLSERGINVIVRLNHGYGRDGTIPLPDKYDYFAQQCAMFVETSIGCSRWIIGNEPNHEQEWPQGQTIDPYMYAECFTKCVGHIRRRVSGQKIITAAIAPWNVQAGDWISYFSVMLQACSGSDPYGFSIHTYTHGADPSLIRSPAKMDPPYESRHFHFLAYRDFMDAIPYSMRDKSVYITETNQDGEWHNDNTGWVKNAYAEIDLWNQTHTQKIVCLALYRWQKYDKWYIDGKQGVIQDLREAMERNYSAVNYVESSEGYQVFIPVVVNNNDGGNNMPPVEWDDRLTQRGAVLRPYTGNADSYWKIVKAAWMDEQESGGKHHVFVEVLNKDGNREVGVPVMFGWQSGNEIKKSEAKPTENYAVDFPMFAVAPAYWVTIPDDADTLDGLGMGSIEQPNYAIHTSYHVTFQKVSRENVTDSDTNVTTPEPDAPAPTPDSPHHLGVIEEDWIISSLARVLGIDVCVAKAILVVESNRNFFNEFGRPTIRFENHIFCQLTKDACPDLFKHDNEYPWLGHKYRKSTGHNWIVQHTGDQGIEEDALDLAKILNRKAAFSAIAMGAPQIMGFNHHRIGYDTAEEMYKAFSHKKYGKYNQIVGMFTFVSTSHNILSAARELRFNDFAVGYNGPGNAAAYAAQLRSEYTKCKK